MALGPKHKWAPEEVQSIRDDKKTMTVTQLVEKYQLRKAQICYALYYYIDTSSNPSENEDALRQALRKDDLGDGAAAVYRTPRARRRRAR